MEYRNAIPLPVSTSYKGSALGESTSHEKMNSCKVGITDEMESMQLPIEFQYSLTCFSNLQEYVVFMLMIVFVA